MADPIDELVTGEDDTTGTDESTSNPYSPFYSVEQLITSYFTAELFSFYFTVGQQVSEFFADTQPGGGASRGEKWYSIQEIMNDPKFDLFIDENTRNLYNNVIKGTSENSKEDTLTVISNLRSSFEEIKQVTKGDTEGFWDKRFTTPREVEEEGPDWTLLYQKKVTDNGSSALSEILTPKIPTETGLQPSEIVDTPTNFDDFIAFAEEEWETVEELDTTITKRKELEEELEEATSLSQQSFFDSGQFSTSGKAWGYSTKEDGSMLNPNPNWKADGEGEVIAAPFMKGDEYRDFLDLNEAEIFLLQQQLVRAGMSAPPVTEWGKWTPREAQYMTYVFMYATDEGTWYQDKVANVPQYTTALAEMANQYEESTNYVEMLKEKNFGMDKPNLSTAEIKSYLDAGAAASGVVLSNDDYVNFANVVISALEQEQINARKIEDLKVTDRDLILSAEFKSPYGPYGSNLQDYGYTLRGMTGSSLPLVLPSYEYLVGEKGTVPQKIDAETIISDEIKKLKAGQIEGNVDLANIKRATNVFEAMMSGFTYGGAESTG